MTREEAINNLNDLRNEVYNEDSDGHIYAEAIDMAIKALSVDGALIRREDIVYHTQLEPMGNGQYEDVEVAYRSDIEALPSAEAEGSLKAIKRQIEEHWLLDAHSAEAVQGWIPCSERLPDESEFVLITIDIGTVTEEGTAMVEQVLTAHYSSADGEENLFQTIGYGNVFLSKEVTAWRPLPKPYRGRR